MTPYSISSDHHCHAWSAFATTLEDGSNSRLRAILHEMNRQAELLRTAGGNTILFAGDLFHVRGSIDPSVLNPVVETIRGLIEDGFRFHAIPGNHDLKSNDTTVLGNAIQVLDELDGFNVVTSPTRIAIDGHVVVMFPWRASLDALRDDVHTVRAHFKGDMSAADAIIHAPINGSLPETFSGAFEAFEVGSWGFRRVYSGHFHNHAFLGDGVFSVGASTQQTWRDIGSLAGFLMVDDETTFVPAGTPSFVEVGEEDFEDEAKLRETVNGNYVRVRYETITPAQEKEIRQGLTDMGAAGIVIQAARAGSVVRSTATIKTGASLDMSVSDYVRSLSLAQEPEVLASCNSVLSKAREVDSEAE